MTAETTTAVAMGSVAATSASVSVIAGSTPQSLWSMVNQFQFYLLIPLVGAQVPDAVIEFLEGLDFVFFNFDFIEIPPIPYYSKFLAYFDCGEGDAYFDIIGISSQCAIVNHIKLVFMFG